MLTRAYERIADSLLRGQPKAKRFETRRLEEAGRIAAVRKQALGKLTEEEKLVLGINEYY